MRRLQGPLPDVGLDVEAERHVQRDGLRVQVLQGVRAVGQEARADQEALFYAGAKTSVQQ